MPPHPRAPTVGAREDSDSDGDDTLELVAMGENDYDEQDALELYARS